VLGWNFAAANAATIEIDLLWITLVEISVWQLAIASFALGGAIVGTTVGFFWLRGWELRRRYRKTIRKLESELHQMRSLPLSGAADAVFVESDLVGSASLSDAAASRAAGARG
jgi:hypothetical protein